MTRWSYHIAALLALVIVPEPALGAGWDRVAWGASSAEIAAAYGERARVLQHPIIFGDSYADIVLLDTPFAGYAFRVYFQMDKATSRLAHVLLERRRQYANPKVWNAVVAGLREMHGPPDDACNEAAERGRPTVVEGVWQRPGETVTASYLDFAAPVMRYSPNEYLAPNQLLEVQPYYHNLYPARRIVVRYSVTTEPSPGKRRENFDSCRAQK